jgi:hypothetical protein
MIPVLIAALAININLSSLTHRSATASVPSPTCHISTVSYLFVGEPGTEFTYDGERFVVPATGSVELIAGRHPADVVVAGRHLPLDLWPRDQFGMRTVPLPKPAVADASIASLDDTQTR